MSLLNLNLGQFWSAQLGCYKSHHARYALLASLLSPLTCARLLNPSLVMLLLSSLASFVILANVVAADPIVVRGSTTSLPFLRHMKATGIGALILRDLERARSFVHRNGASTSETTGSVGVTNADSCYTISASVGIPPTYCGSS
jgi:hypothetical protein